MSFYGHWQPLVDEDAHTALVFGFFRHAPREVALNLWLSDVLERPVRASDLLPNHFWPGFHSVVTGSAWTIPELAFPADDSDRLTVVIEVKPGYGMHALDQISREVTDVAAALGARRIACVMIGADLSRPAETVGWEEQISEALGGAIDEPVAFELQYSSFARIGRAISQCAENQADWSNYAADVIGQLRRKGLLGYEGAPMLDDLGELTVMTAVEGFNRTVRAARQFFLQLHGQEAFAKLGLAAADWNYRMLRNGKSEVPTQSEAWFDTTVLLSVYQHESLPEGWFGFVAFDFTAGPSSVPSLLVGRLTEKDPYRLGEALLSITAQSDGSEEAASVGTAEYHFRRRPWLPGDADGDVSWTIERLEESLLS